MRRENGQVLKICFSLSQDASLILITSFKIHSKINVLKIVYLEFGAKSKQNIFFFLWESLDMDLVSRGPSWCFLVEGRVRGGHFLQK